MINRIVQVPESCPFNKTLPLTEGEIGGICLCISCKHMFEVSGVNTIYHGHVLSETERQVCHRFTFANKNHRITCPKCGRSEDHLLMYCVGAVYEPLPKHLDCSEYQGGLI